MSNLAVATLAVITLTAWALATIELVLGSTRLRRLADTDPGALPNPAPRVSVVVAARDEERHLASAMRALLAVDYPALEIIAVNDRSTDRTGAILDEIAVADTRLRVIHVHELPVGWLGKNHAMHVAAQTATGEWILFTDADVFFAPDTLRRALALAVSTPLDHLVLSPRTTGGTVLMRAFLGIFALAFALNMRPWRAREAGRSEHIGVGAFNLVRKDTLAALGFLKRIRLRPDDDMKLGKIIKQAGGRQEFVDAGDAIQLEWYRTTGEMVHGLEKNSFPFLDYSVPRTLAAVAAVVLLMLWPLFALAVVSGIAFWCNLASVLLTLLLVAASMARGLALSPLYALGYPLGALLMMVTITNSMLRTLVQGGVRWRGTLYPLAELKANRV